ncbi:hypothetical protein EIP91_010089 [Steccherinum ochraceum]|uniref:Protein kinase domain-containing protein n=1 Tax=Steccherinum ochraceum TaxID=92696 RepID=A0A4R0RUX2_9APHY|nr:hypothetical protein EIP91_010089 [Steccherinum ochraceum]
MVASSSKPLVRRVTRSNTRAAKRVAAATASLLAAASTSSRSASKKRYRVAVLFFHPEVNADSTVALLDLRAEDFVEAAAIGDLTFKIVSLLTATFKFHADETTVKFYSPKKPIVLDDIEDDFIVKTGNITDIARKRQPALGVQLILGNPEELDRSLVHLLVTAEARASEQVAQAEAEAEDEVLALPLHQLGYRNTLAGAKTMKSPSVAAKSLQYGKYQADPRFVIYDGFYMIPKQSPSLRGQPSLEPVRSTIAPPIQIFHPVFDTLLEDLANPNFKPDADIIPKVSDMMQEAAEIIVSEPRRNAVLRKHLSIIFGRSSDQILEDNNRSADGSIRVKIGNVMWVIAIEENKRHLGEGGCDPSTQAEYSAVQIISQEKYDFIRDHCCCPTILLAGGGPYLAVLGAVMTDKFIVQRLTDMLWLGEASTYEDAHVYRISRVFTALRQALDRLDTYYTEELQLPAPSAEPSPSRYFPYPTSYSTTVDDEVVKVEFEYKECMENDATSVTYLAEVKGSEDQETPTKLVVKFVDRYGAEVHRLLASNELAPQLLYFGSLDGESPADASPALEFGLYVGNVRMIVMQHVDGMSAFAAERVSQPWPEDLYDTLARAMKIVHKEDFVFGDLRPPNVMLVEGGGVQLIDFNWAGKEGEARYPRKLHPEAFGWGSAKEFELIKKEHDKESLEYYFGKRS